MSLIICIGSKYEHDAVDRWLDVRVGNMKELETALRSFRGEGDALVFWLAVNNVTGEVCPIVDIGKLCKKYGAYYICDATAMVGHVTIPEDIDQWCSMMIIDGHKIGTQLGIGCMWISDEFNKWLGGMKLHGTPNLAGAISMADAVEWACDSKRLNATNNRNLRLFDYLYCGLKRANIDFSVIADMRPSTCAINAIRLNGLNADSLQQYCASKGVYIGVGGSACNAAGDFRVLNAYKLTDTEASEVIRVSFGDETNKYDVDALVSAISEYKQKYC